MNLVTSKELGAQLLSTHPVVTLRLADTWKAARTWNDAFLDDPMITYLRAGEKPRSTSNRVAVTVVLALWMQSKVVLTVNGGAALIVASPVQTGSPPIERLADILINWIATAAQKLGTAEQKKRNKETKEKIAKVTALVLGDRVNEMLYVSLLATEPQSQGQGLGSALLETVTSYADILGQSAWLVSSNVLNTGFYNSHGFKTVGEAYLGDDNSEWHQVPVIIRIVSSSQLNLIWFNE
ncbi:hypothetical protein GALMADRAFT_236428 [Galerina marginata CBS 339.88]|uniref:N-acetyltransferase domain-containing protein n=1 Tax=Galerina marginata (strain CBS 339.88) TaxID=685588 RepID=A0A067TL66_GALM3|nr:hypothetical protein GALMADRAFT_236428 [Galerina marginata CBS 339.88]